MRLLSDVASRVEDPYLRHAVALAERGRGATSPNPLVGCVVVRDGRIVGEGFHPRAGEAHAEVFALADAGEAARGADVYVTLEPCLHHGRTPPCTDALVEAGVRRVVIGMADPTAEAGGGAGQLREAGIAVKFAADPSPFAELNEGWIKRLATGLPFVTAKVGLSLDGRPALMPGQRAAITGLSGAEVSRRLRARADAVLVGAATVIADDPQLTIRDSAGTPVEHQPQRVVLVRSHVPHEDAKLFTDGQAPTVVLASDATSDVSVARVREHALIERYPEAEGLAGALAALGDRGVNELLIEPGPRLFSALLNAGLIDQLVTVVAGGVAGDMAPEVYRGVATAEEDRLLHPFAPVEAGIVGDVSVTVWRPASDATEIE